MEAITAEIIPSEKKRDARGHRLYDEERQRRVLEGYDQSGLTQKAYAKREGIKYSTLVSWLQGRRRAGWVAKPRLRFAELALPAAGSRCALEVVLTDGTQVRGHNARDLAEVVRLLRA